MPPQLKDPELVDAFQKKRDQALPLMENPLLLIHIKWDSASLRMFTLDAIITRHTALLLNPDGSAHIICQAIEDAGFRPLAEVAELHTYSTVDDFYRTVTSLLPKGSTVMAEVSDELYTLDRLPPHAHRRLSAHLNIISADPLLLELRATKTPAELSLMRRAINATYNTFQALSDEVKPGIKESEIARFIAHRAADAGMPYPLNFDPIVASGPRSQDPHPVLCTERAVKKGDYLLIDTGLSCRGYASDITRTFIVGGDPKDDERDGYNTTLVEALTSEPVAGKTPKELADRIKKIAVERGFHHLEKHAYGHGLGTEVHDPYPPLSTVPTPLSDKPLTPGVVFTFEPGFYDEKGGYRIENDYFVGEDGYARLLR